MKDSYDTHSKKCMWECSFRGTAEWLIVNCVRPLRSELSQEDAAFIHTYPTKKKKTLQRAR